MSKRSRPGRLVSVTVKRPTRPTSDEVEAARDQLAAVAGLHCLSMDACMCNTRQVGTASTDEQQLPRVAGR